MSRFNPFATLNIYAVLMIVGLQENDIHLRDTHFRGKTAPLIICPAYFETHISMYASFVFWYMLILRAYTVGTCK